MDRTMRIHTMRLLRIAVLALSTATAFARLGAQQGAQVRALPPAGAGILAGVVTDTAGVSVDGASVFLQGRNREVRTGPDGIFRFTGLKAGDTVTIAARRLGFFPMSARVPIGPDGRQVMVQMRPRLTSLPTVVTEVTLSGISGVVTDTLMQPVRGAEVQAVGAAGGIVRTDSAGTFSLEASAGSYVLRVTHAGFMNEMVGITVPKRGGRQVAVRLVPGRDPYRNREAFAIDGMRARLLRASSANSAAFTREDIAKLNPRDVAAISRVGVRGRTEDYCFATVNGIHGQVPLWAIDPEEIEFMEVYARPVDMGNTRQPRGRTSITGARGPALGGYSPPPPRVTGAEECPLGGIYIWTSK
jgi:hypothetical protein